MALASAIIATPPLLAVAKPQRPKPPPPNATASDSQATPPRSRYDGRRLPSPLVTAEALDLRVTLRRGYLSVSHAHRVQLPKPRALRRDQGPFEIRLYSGKTLRDVIGFSMPLTLAGNEPATHGVSLGRTLALHVTTTTVVRIPYETSITHIEVVDGLHHRRSRHQIAALLPKTKTKP